MNMKKFLSRFILFFIPLFIITIVVSVIDPYNYFFHGNFISDNAKISVINRSPESMPRGNTLWKSIDFKQHPLQNIIIGDSRAFDLNTDTIAKVSGTEYFNFGVPGGNFRSVIETFWYINDLVKLDKVYIQVGFYNYSAGSDYNLMSDAKKVMRKPYLFFTRFYFFNESLLDVFYSFRHEEQNENRSGDDFDADNWEKVLKKQGENSINTMRYPENYYKELKKIAAYCEENNIELSFIIFPDQEDFHQVIADKQKNDLYTRYKADIHSLGKVYDFDVPESKIRDDRSNYRDIFHLKHRLINGFIIPSIWGTMQP